MSEYTEQAENFLTKTNTKFKAEFIEHGKHFDDDDFSRDIYLITLTRHSREMIFRFGQSLVDSRKYRDRNIQDHIYLCDGTGQGKRNGYKVTQKFLDEYCDLVKGTPPNAYDVLACLTKYEVGTFENFCMEFGYEDDSIKALKTHEACQKEWADIQRLWSDDEIEELQEIQ